MQVKRFFRQLFHELTIDNITDVGAMMAFYAVTALFPMLVFVLSLALVVLPEDVVKQGVVMATTALPGSVKDVLMPRVDAVIQASGAGFAVLGAALALWGASRGAVSLEGALLVES